MITEVIAYPRPNPSYTILAKGSMVSDWSPWWRHQMEKFSALLAFCAGNSPVPGDFPAQRPVTRSVDVFFDLGLNIRLSKQSWGWWFETPSRPLWRHCNLYIPLSRIRGGVVPTKVPVRQDQHAPSQSRRQEYVNKWNSPGESVTHCHNFTWAPCHVD